MRVLSWWSVVGARPGGLETPMRFATSLVSGVGSSNVQFENRRVNLPRGMSYSRVIDIVNRFVIGEFQRRHSNEASFCPRGATQPPRANTTPKHETCKFLSRPVSHPAITTPDPPLAPSRPRRACERAYPASQISRQNRGQKRRFLESLTRPATGPCNRVERALTDISPLAIPSRSHRQDHHPRG